MKVVSLLLGGALVGGTAHAAPSETERLGLRATAITIGRGQWAGQLNPVPFTAAEVAPAAVETSHPGAARETR